jgi:hypothetical protein
MRRFRFKSAMDSGISTHSHVKLRELARLQGDGGLEGPVFHRGWAKFI